MPWILVSCCSLSFAISVAVHDGTGKFPHPNKDDNLWGALAASGTFSVFFEIIYITQITQNH